MKGTLAILTAAFGATGILAADPGWPNWRGPSECEVVETGHALTDRVTKALGQDLIEVVAHLGQQS